MYCVEEETDRSNVTRNAVNAADLYGSVNEAFPRHSRVSDLSFEVRVREENADVFIFLA